MKKIGIFILGLCSLSLVGNFTQANNEYEYTNLDITANILIDGTINVKENFTANFFVDKHGIFRTIPLNYSVDGNDFHIDISNINVQGKKFTTSKSNGERTIKIGDPNITLNGIQNYPISYATYGLIRNFSGMGYAELYWNLVGYEFDTNINKVKAELILPKPYTGFTADDFLITTDGKTTSIKDFGGTVNWKNGDRITITYDKGLPAYQGITLAIKFPNNYFEFDHNRQANLLGHTDNYKEMLKQMIDDALEEASNGDFRFLVFIICILLIVLVMFSPVILLIVVILKFFLKLFKNIGGSIKESKRESSEIIQYNPPKGLNSAEVGILYHRYNDPKDTFSLIYKWASEGLIKIQSGEETASYTLVKIKNISGNNPEYEKDLFNKLFSEDELVLNHQRFLYKTFIDSGLQNYGIEKGRFSDKGGKSSIGCLRGLLIFIIVPILLYQFSPILGIGSFVLLWCILLFGGPKGWLQSKTLKGTEEGEKLISHILGYKQFLKACDENKLRTLLKQDPLYFDKTLPYAVVFGLDTELIKKITPIMEEMDISPSRYDKDIGNLSTSIGTINSSIYSSGGSSYSSDSGFDSGSSFDSGGGGFDSGGGGGGGGGGSW